MPAKKPKPHDLKQSARRDLDAIWDYTSAQWSTKQADAYVRGIAAAIERVAANPELAHERAEYDPPVRIYRVQSHIIIYRDLPDRVSIIRIRHGSEDWADDPAEGEADF